MSGQWEEIFELLAVERDGFGIVLMQPFKVIGAGKQYNLFHSSQYSALEMIAKPEMKK